MHSKRKSDFNPHAFLSTIGKGREMESFQKKHTVFAKAIPRMDFFLSKRGRCGSASYRKVGKKQRLAFWAKAISLAKVALQVSFCECPLQPQ